MVIIAFGRRISGGPSISSRTAWGIRSAPSSQRETLCLSYLRPSWVLSHAA